MGSRNRVEPWAKNCPECGEPVTHHTALAHMQRHGAMLRVEPWIHTEGMPEATFDELAGFMARLRRKASSGE